MKLEMIPHRPVLLWLLVGSGLMLAACAGDFTVTVLSGASVVVSTTPSYTRADSTYTAANPTALNTQGIRTPSLRRLQLSISFAGMLTLP